MRISVKWVTRRFRVRVGAQAGFRVRIVLWPRMRIQGKGIEHGVKKREGLG